MCSPNFSNGCNWNQSFWAVLRPLGMVQSVSLGSGCPRRFGPGLLKPSRKYVTIWEWQDSSKQLQIKDIIRRPAGVSCGSCFFVVVLSVLSVFLSRLSPWRGFLPRLTWTPALLPPSTPSSSSFRLYLSLRCGGLNSAHASLHTAWFILVLHILLSFRWLFPFFWLRLPSVCSVASYIQYFNHWHNLSKYCLFQRLFQRGLFQNPGWHMLWFKLKPWLEQNQCFASKPSFTQRTVLHKNCVVHKHHVVHKNYVASGPVQGLFTAYRWVLSVVAGGTCRRQLNK